MHQLDNSSRAQHPPPTPPPRLLRGIFLPYSPGGGVLANFALLAGREFANHEATNEILGTHVVSNPNITTQRILLGKQADWLICQGGERIIEDCKGMFSFLCMYSFIEYQARIT